MYNYFFHFFNLTSGDWNLCSLETWSVAGSGPEALGCTFPFQRLRVQNVPVPNGLCLTMGELRAISVLQFPQWCVKRPVGPVGSCPAYADSKITRCFRIRYMQLHNTSVFVPSGDICICVYIDDRCVMYDKNNDDNSDSIMYTLWTHTCACIYKCMHIHVICLYTCICFCIAYIQV